MSKLWTRRLVLAVAVLLALMIPLAVYADRVCRMYQDGCTICDFYGPKGEYQGYISWCH
jgi:hypothetical protein